MYTISASEAKNRLGNLIEKVMREKSEYVIENRGKPQVVMVAFSEYDALQKLKIQQKKQQVFEEMEILRDSIASRNKDLKSDEAALKVADSLIHKPVSGARKKKKLR